MTLFVVVPRDCPYGHGTLETLEGWWALEGVNVLSAQQSRARGGPDRVSFNTNGRYFALRARKCSECGLVMLFDEEPR